MNMKGAMVVFHEEQRLDVSRAYEEVGTETTVVLGLVWFAPQGPAPVLAPYCVRRT